MNIPLCVEKRTDEYAKNLEAFSPKIARMYKKCYVNTLETAAVPMDDGSYFILTGDIPAMWLRDSTLLWNRPRPGRQRHLIYICWSFS